MKHLERDNRILEHIGSFVISFRPVIAKLFFGGRMSACTEVLTRLQNEGRIKSVAAFPGTRHKYYQLEARGADETARPHYRTRSLGETALNRHVAVLWWCCFGSRQRYRLSDSDLAKVLGTDPPTGLHCIERSQKAFTVCHVYPLAPKAVIKPVIGRIRNNIEEKLSDKTLREWVEAKQYQFVILAESKDRRRDLENWLFDQEFKDQFDPSPWIRVEPAPDVATVTRYLTDLSKGTSTR